MKVLMIMLGISISIEVAASEESGQGKAGETSTEVAETENVNVSATQTTPSKESKTVSVVETASPKDRPLRPTTHPGDPALSDSPVENFQKLYCEPSSIAAVLSPATAIEDSSNVLRKSTLQQWGVSDTSKKKKKGAGVRGCLDW